ncbi:two-component sensor histidine kinase [Streptomyces venezuelae]|uniref:histidine kinase n=1 Tax=Streptomyces venezuelae TaxID=54571 RepID=A0A5P2CTT9_STRVZ|nr:histidine kinase [Streptomyces venezuelae]QES44279.1 two-component sensor histidine kinase [Streptomyces venezuelae]
MSGDWWTRWPSREALTWAGMSLARLWFVRVLRVVILGSLLWDAFHTERGWRLVAGVAIVLAVAGVGWAFFRVSFAHRLWPSLALMSLLWAAAIAAESGDWQVLATVLWCGSAISALERLPMVAAAPCVLLAMTGYAAYIGDSPLTTALVVIGLALAGYTLRLDAEARGSALRLLTQERAARVAETEAAALAERARIAREIHDVLAHSLSAQLVHLEAARLLIEGDASKEQVLGRVVAARSMAREGLAETRQALSALRGEMTPVEDFLRELVAADRASVTVTGDRRPLPAEASQAVRRVAQEALTNVRKHAPGAQVEVCLRYENDQVRLDVRDSGGKSPGELAASGAGYGLLGMRERAELLGGSLEAGPGEEGFVVTLRVPG